MKYGPLIGMTASTVAFAGSTAIPINAILLALTRRAIPFRPVIFLMMSVISFYIVHHVAVGNISLSEGFKNAARLLLPLLIAIICYEALRHQRNSGIEGLVLGLSIVAMIDLSGVVFYILRTFDYSTIYNIKDKNLIFQNTNYTAFILYCSFVAQLSMSKKPSKSILFLTITMIALTYSRSYWVAALLTGLMVKIHIPSRWTLAALLITISVAPVYIASYPFDTSIIRQNFDSSFATKIEILLYSGKFFGGDFNIGFWGMGPQVKIEDLVITHSGHSLFGMLPELGFVYIAYIALFSFYLLKGSRYSILHFPGTFIFLFSTFPVSNLGAHFIFLLLFNERPRLEKNNNNTAI